MELREHEGDEVVARLMRDRETIIGRLSDAELADELLVAALARDHRRIDRFNELLAERAPRTRGC